MKKSFTRLCLILFAFIPFVVFANAYVRGTVKYANGAPAANYPVYIVGDSLVNASNCYQRHVRYTNASGNYSDTLTCTASFSTVHTWVYAGNNIISHVNTFNPNQVAESNFMLPDSAAGACRAIFTSSVLNSTAYFNSIASLGTQQNDSIISRTWNFGDGTSQVGNVYSPLHIYAQAGTFPVCLKIKTLVGCENTFCYNVVVLANNSCNAIFSWTPLPTTLRRIAFNSSASLAIAGDSIISRKWRFGDGDTLTGNVVSPEHIYAAYGVYSACLTIKTRLGCEKTFCLTLPLVNPVPACRTSFNSENIAVPSGGNAALKYKRFITTSTTPLPDSITVARWTFGDGTSLTTSASNRPAHGYTQVGTYTVCLYITSATGCTDSNCQAIIVRDSTVANTACQPRFATAASGLMVTFNANTSTTAAGDSIISRSWAFGDGVTINNNAPVLTHQYPRAGIFQACLTIRTRLGCVSTTCKAVAVVTVPGNCIPYFTKEQIAATPRTIRFNSSAAYSQIPNDSIIARKWEFGDGQILTGNVVNPLHTYLRGGTYTACLTIYTAHCNKRWCQTIQVFPLDSTNTADSVSIVSLYPVPVTSPLNVVIHSSHATVTAQLAIYDVYGVLKSTQTVVLPLGNSNYSIPTAQLAAGPYIFKLTTVYGTISRTFYKL